MKFAHGLLGHLYRAILITVVLSALTHLTIIFFAYLTTRNVALINPVVFLGFDIVAPQYIHSALAVGLGWAALVSAGSVIFLLRSRQLIRKAAVRYGRRAHKWAIRGATGILLWIERTLELDSDS